MSPEPEERKMTTDVTGMILERVNLSEMADEGDRELSGALGIAFEEISAYRHALEVSKIPAAEELVSSYEDAGEPVVVFGCYVEPVTKIGTREGWGLITGETPMAKRAETVAAFQDGKLKGIALTINCAGFGLTLTRAKVGIFMSLPWTAADLDQAEDRLCRIGQKAEGLLYIHLVANDRLDRRVAQILAKKRMIIRHSVSAASNRGEAVKMASEVAEASVAALSAATSAPSPAAAPVAPSAPSASPTPASRPLSTRRGPKDAKEAWAARALSILAGSDPDRARIVNGCGFNKIDNEFGHSLAEQLPRGLSEKQWAAAVKIAMRYPRQVGRPE